MEKRTMADIRREKFNKQGQIARDLADLALRDIDEALGEHHFQTPNVVELPRRNPDFPEPPEAA